MTQKHGDQQPDSFGEMVELIENYIRGEIIREAAEKQLYYHNIDHALQVKRRAGCIFQAIKPILAQSYSAHELWRIANLIDICALAHDMVQIFELTPVNHPRKRLSNASEIETANKLLRYIKNLDRVLATNKLDRSFLFNDHEQQIIKDAILATICVPDPLGNRTENAFSDQSIYQPYLYNPHDKISIVGSIIALADLGTLGIDGVEAYVQDGILIFLEDNPHFEQLMSNCDRLNIAQQEDIKTKLLSMNRFIVALAHERQARFEQEIAGFASQIRQILRHQVFVYLNHESIAQVTALVPNQPEASYSELVSFFCSNKIHSTRSHLNR
ncbi:MAG: hypothetical protein AAFQ14_18655 [Cyanobacteria bacterium J06621_12]